MSSLKMTNQNLELIYEINALDTGPFDAHKMRQYTLMRPHPTIQQKLKRKMKTFYIRRINMPAILKFLLVRFPLLETIGNYNMKDILYDCLSGASIGFVHVAQGLAYANLAGVNTASGLYTSLFAPIFYAILGGSKHLSMGTFAVVSLLTKGVTENCVQHFTSQNESLSQNATAIALIRTEVSTSLILLVGITLVAMAIFKCGVLVSYLTDSLISGYLCASGFFVFTSQIPSGLGFVTERGNGLGIFFQRWYYIFRDVHKANPPTVIVFFITLIPLFLGRYLNKRYMKFIKFALPLELIAIAIATAVTANTDVGIRYHIKSIGHLPSGLPKPSIPPSKYFSCLGSGFFSIAVVTMAINFSIVARYADKHGYSVSMNQELFAYGIADILCSFFLCFPACGSISRTAIAASNLQKTQLSAFVSSAFLIIIIYTITSYLQYLPLAILSAIVVVNIIPTILQVTECIKFWKITKIEGLVWLGAFLATLIFDVDNGLFISIIISLLLNTITIQRPSIKILGRMESNPNLFLDIRVFPVKEIQGTKIVLMAAPLVSYNAKYLKKRILEECQYPRGHRKPAIFSLHQKILGSLIVDYQREDTETESGSVTFPKYLILDCSMMFAIDSNGIQTLREVNEITASYGTQIMLCGLREQVLSTASNAGFFDTFNDKNLYLSVGEAVERIEKDCMQKEEGDHIYAEEDDGMF